MVSTLLSLLFLAALAAPGVAALRRAGSAFTVTEQIALGAPLGIIMGAGVILLLAIALGFSVGLVIAGGMIAALAGWELWPGQRKPAVLARLTARRSRSKTGGRTRDAGAVTSTQRLVAEDGRSVSALQGAPSSRRDALGERVGAVTIAPEAEAHADGTALDDAALDPAPDQRALRGRRRLWSHTARREWRGALLPILVIGGLGLLWSAFYATSMTYDAEGLRAGHQHIWSDWSVHLGHTTSFAYADNFPPHNPFYAGHSFNYHFLIAFTSACLVKLGMDPVASLKLHDLLLSCLVTLAVFAFARRLTSGDGAAAALALLLFMLGGGFGWALTVGEANRSHDLWRTLLDHPWNYDRQIAATIRWEPVFLVAIAPTRGTLYGLPLGMLCLTLLWQGLVPRATGVARPSWPAARGGRDEESVNPGDTQSGDGAQAGQIAPDTNGAATVPTHERASAAASTVFDSQTVLGAERSSARVRLAAPVRDWRAVPERWRWFLAAGAVAGLLPYAHLGTLLALALVTPALFLLFPRREWLIFFAAWVLIAVPQLLLQGGAGSGHSEWYTGWMAHVDPAHADSIPWFWLKNLGLIIPLLLIALCSRRLVSPMAQRYLWAFMPLFVVANVVSFDPTGPWNNLKVLIYWYLGACVLVGALVARAWRSSPAPLARFLIGGALLTMTLSGALMHLHQLRGLDSYELFSTDELRFAERVRAETPPHAIFATGFEHNPVVTALAGRQVLLFFPPYLVSWGIDSRQREQDVRDLFAFAPDTPAIIAKYQIDYVVIGPSEEQLKPNVDAFAATYPLAIETETYKVFDVRASKHDPFLGNAPR